MPNIEKDLVKNLAQQLEELAAENAPNESDSENAPLISEADVLAGASASEATDAEKENSAASDRISEMTAALAKLAAEGKLQEPNLDFIDGASSDIDYSTAIDLITQSMPGEEFGESSMIVGEAEQLPMMGLEVETEEAAQVEEEAEEVPTEFIDNDKLISIVESLLFATDKPVSIATMKVLFKGSNIRTKDISRALDGLASSYAAADRGVSVEEIHGGYQLRTKVDNTEYLKRLAKVRPFRLSGPALEVLAIAAYKQPITKTEVDQIRGVESGHLMRALMERGMVGFGDKSDLPGRPMTYVTTRKFLETFGLRNLKELPTLAEIDQLLPEGIGEEEEKETLSMVTESMSNHVGSTYSEGEEELGDISESLKAIDTTSEFFEQEKIRQRVERDKERAQDLRDKLTFGDEVDDKDRRWLSRYETKQEQIAQAAEAGETAGPLIVEEEGVAESLAALTAEGASGAQASGDGSVDNLVDSADETSDDDEGFDELAAKPDFEDTDSDGSDVDVDHGPREGDV
jgi:segregation and condensation protein B